MGNQTAPNATTTLVEEQRIEYELADIVQEDLPPHPQTPPPKLSTSSISLNSSCQDSELAALLHPLPMIAHRHKRRKNKVQNHQNMRRSLGQVRTERRSSLLSSGLPPLQPDDLSTFRKKQKMRKSTLTAFEFVCNQEQQSEEDSGEESDSPLELMIRLMHIATAPTVQSRTDTSYLYNHHKTLNDHDSTKLDSFLNEKHRQGNANTEDLSPIIMQNFPCREIHDSSPSLRSSSASVTDATIAFEDQTPISANKEARADRTRFAKLSASACNEEEKAEQTGALERILHSLSRFARRCAVFGSAATRRQSRRSTDRRAFARDGRIWRRIFE
eukprot:GDKJ01014617.1.p1 GENE.GDKJ01014617.1~~GDKJ01014617.1.p1  ORF type:complete len:330 (+),score=73.85 GDKJ01014617.1:1-990(+)